MVKADRTRFCGAVHGWHLSKDGDINKLREEMKKMMSRCEANSFLNYFPRLKHNSTQEQLFTLISVSTSEAMENHIKADERSHAQKRAGAATDGKYKR